VVHQRQKPQEAGSVGISWEPPQRSHLIPAVVEGVVQEQWVFHNWRAVFQAVNVVPHEKIAFRALREFR